MLKVIFFSYVLRCYNEDCKWIMKTCSLKKLEVFMIQKFIVKHTCQMSDRVLKNLQATTAFVSDITTSKLVNHKKIHTLGDIIEEIKVFYEVDINYMKT